MPTPAQARVLIVDDDVTYVRTLRAQLSCAEDLEVVADAADGPSALRLARELRPDVVLLDIVLPGMNGLEVARRLRQAAPDARVVALTGHPSWDYAFEIFGAGGAGFVPKSHAPDELLPVIRAALKGECCISPAVFGAVARRGAGDDAALDETPAGDDPSAREREVVAMLAQRFSYKEMAAVLGVSERTVETYRGRIMTKWGVSSTAELVRLALKRGYVPRR
ncbi:MAG: response regulator transcription factor [Deltaproteobacteria bacterium]|nr:response regulator transcription factor [Deltaproteobacteria bacterium]